MRTVKVKNPHAVNLIMGRFPFVKTIDEIHQALVEKMPGTRFGLAFSETSTPDSVRAAGTDVSLMDLAKQNADNIGAHDTFVLFLDESGPVPVMNVLKCVPNIDEIYCATNNQAVEVIVAEKDGEAGIVGLLGAYSPAEEKVVHIVKKRRSIFHKFSRKH